MRKLLLVSLLTCVAQLSAADVAYSPVVGGITVTLSGAVSGVPKLSTFSPAMRLPLSGSFVGRGRGVLTGADATTFTDSAAGWSAGALSQAATPYFVRIRSGTAEGTWWQVSSSAANTTTAVTVLNRGITPAAAGVVAGDSYEIVPGDTLATLFSGIAATTGGTSAATADLVRVHDGVNWREYYYNTTVSQWREGTSTFNRNNIVVRPDAGVVYVRRSEGNVSFLQLGAVSNAKEQILIGASGVTPIGNVFPVARTLGSLNLQASAGFISSTGDLAAADKVTVFDGINWRSFHYNQSVGQWREGTSTFNRNTLNLPFGAAIVVERGSAASTPTFLSLTPPYTL